MRKDWFPGVNNFELAYIGGILCGWKLFYGKVIHLKMFPDF